MDKVLNTSDTILLIKLKGDIIKIHMILTQITLFLSPSCTENSAFGQNVCARTMGILLTGISNTFLAKYISLFLFFVRRGRGGGCGDGCGGGRGAAAHPPSKLAPRVPHLNLVGRFWTAAQRRRFRRFWDVFERFRAFSDVFVRFAVGKYQIQPLVLVIRKFAVRKLGDQAKCQEANQGFANFEICQAALPKSWVGQPFTVSGKYTVYLGRYTYAAAAAARLRLRAKPPANFSGDHGWPFRGRSVGRSPRPNWEVLGRRSPPT